MDNTSAWYLARWHIPQLGATTIEYRNTKIASNHHSVLAIVLYFVVIHLVAYIGDAHNAVAHFVHSY